MSPLPRNLKLFFPFQIFPGTPEMAFIHALAAATTASFIARACRDGQLASCGCSRSARPSQLHEDWTWGGCGDDLEFGYKWVSMVIKKGLISMKQNPFIMKYSKILYKFMMNHKGKSVCAEMSISNINSQETTTQMQTLNKAESMNMFICKHRNINAKRHGIKGNSKRCLNLNRKAFQ